MNKVLLSAFVAGIFAVVGCAGDAQEPTAGDEATEAESALTRGSLKKCNVVAGRLTGKCTTIPTVAGGCASTSTTINAGCPVGATPGSASAYKSCSASIGYEQYDSSRNCL